MSPADLKSWRARLGLTQAAAAAALGVSRRTYEGWEAGRPPEQPELLALAMRALEQRLEAREAG